MEEYLFELDEKKIVIAGADEAGRGPLAGPVVAAAVILPDDFPLSILGDSKALSEKNRLKAEQIIREKAIYAICAISHKVIDKINILNASLLAMARCYKKLKMNNHIDLFLVDGNKTPDVDIEVQAIVKGDAKVPEIMAASILAKNERDRIMELADKKWPEYGYKKHKGYPTKAHYEAIKKYGPSPISRLSFKQFKDEDSSEDGLLFKV